jgi:hypothetical protein
MNARRITADKRGLFRSSEVLKFRSSESVWRYKLKEVANGVVGKITWAKR